MVWCSMNRVMSVVAIVILVTASCMGEIENGHVATGGHIDEVNIVIPTQTIIFDSDLFWSLDFNKFNFYFYHGLLTMQYDNETIVPMQDDNTLYYYVEIK